MHKSSSIEQQNAAVTIFQQLCANMNWNPSDFLFDPYLTINTNHRVLIRPDFYSDKEKVIGEIFAHIGKLKPAQSHKICADILKMMLFEKANNVELRKMIVVCSDAIEEQLTGNSYVSEAIRQFGIEPVRIDIDPELRESLLWTQERQRMVKA